MQKLFLSLAALTVVAAPMAAHAATCRDANGRFTACAKPAPAAKPKPAAKPAVKAPQVAKATPAKAPAKRCRLNGKFASCATPGAKPV